MSLEKSIRQGFERLGPGDLAVTSDTTPQYNCIAWAMGDHTRWWWPSQEWYWPPGAPREETVEAFAAAFATVGFQPCEDGSPQDGIEKVALFTAKGKPTHASFGLPDGRWASKLGKNHDVEHTTATGIGGQIYGEPTHFFSRPAPANPRPKMSNVIAEMAAKYGIANQPERKAARKVIPKKKKR